jgi:hypothetical protein
MRVTITVTWMDGQEKAFYCEHWTTKDGVLYLTTRNGIDPQPKRGIPLANVRMFTE